MMELVERMRIELTTFALRTVNIYSIFFVNQLLAALAAFHPQAHPRVSNDTLLSACHGFDTTYYLLGAQPYVVRTMLSAGYGVAGQKTVRQGLPPRLLPPNFAGQPAKTASWRFDISRMFCRFGLTMNRRRCAP